MGKHKLTNKQIRQIAQRQDQIPEDAVAGQVIQTHGLSVDIDVDNQRYEAVPFRRTVPPCVVGDRVYVDFGCDKQPIIVARSPRDNALHEGPRAVAANIDAMLIVFSAAPAPHDNTLDRYLVSAEMQHIQPVLILNKSDLLREHPHFLAQVQHYFDLGYPHFMISTHHPHTLTPLHDFLDQKVCVLTGQSGTGKSSLVNTLLGDEQQLIGGLQQSNRGKHTTSQSRWFDCHGGAIIDTPGVRSFQCPTDAKLLAQHFIDFRPFIRRCRFRNCEHREHDLGCAVVAAVKQGWIYPERLKQYYALQRDQRPGNTHG